MTAGEIADTNKRRRFQYQRDKVDNDAANYREYVNDHLVF